jgi:hypothetical protein
MTYQQINSRISSEFLKRSITCRNNLLDLLRFIQLAELILSLKNKYYKIKYLSSFIPLYLALPLSESNLFTFTNVGSNTFILFGKDLFMLASKEDYFDFCINDMTSPMFWAREHTSIYSEI